MLDVKVIEDGGVVYRNTAKLVLGDNVYEITVVVFETGDYHVEVNDEFVENYAPINTLDEIVEMAWDQATEWAHEDAQNKAFASEFDEENN